MALTTSQLVAFIEKQIKNVPGPQKLNSRYLNIVCPFHKDSDPSLGIRIAFPTEHTPIGSIKCLGCGKTGDWNTLADKLRLEKLKSTTRIFDDQIVVATSKYDRLFYTAGFPARIRDDCKVVVAIPWNKSEDWRGFSGDLINALGGQSALVKTSVGGILPRLYMPVTVDGEHVGAFVARLKKSAKGGVPSYINAPGTWAKDLGLWPYDYVAEMCADTNTTAVVLVEGPRDALRCIADGVPALCTFGTQSMSKAKLKKVCELPIEAIIPMGDGDQAGHKFNQTIKELAPPQIKIRVARIPITEERYDPYSMPLDMFKHLKRMVRELSV